jgi:enoyl-CoA hydratase/carnithine racemase
VNGFVTPPRLRDYAARYAEHVELQRKDGVLVFRLHHQGGPALTSLPAKNAWVQALRDVGADPENEVVIFTGTGDRWVGRLDPRSFANLGELSPDVLYDHHFGDTLQVLEQLVYGIDVPTIAAINGPVDNYTFGFMADVTICTTTTVVTDGHFAVGSAPGDGLGLMFQALMGVKRAAYAAYMCQPLGAEQLLDLGLVNEVLAPEQLMDRAHEIAATIMRAPRTARRATHAVVSRPWKQLLARDQGYHLSQQLYAMQLQMRADPAGQWQRYREQSGQA